MARAIGVEEELCVNLWLCDCLDSPARSLAARRTRSLAYSSPLCLLQAVDLVKDLIVRVRMSGSGDVACYLAPRQGRHCFLASLLAIRISCCGFPLSYSCKYGCVISTTQCCAFRELCRGDVGRAHRYLRLAPAPRIEFPCPYLRPHLLLFSPPSSLLPCDHPLCLLSSPSSILATGVQHIFWARDPVYCSDTLYIAAAGSVSTVSMVYSLAYRRPSRVTICSQDSSLYENEKSGITSSRPVSVDSGKDNVGVPAALSFDRIIAGGTCPVSFPRDITALMIALHHARLYGFPYLH